MTNNSPCRLFWIRQIRRVRKPVQVQMNCNAAYFFCFLILWDHFSPAGAGTAAHRDPYRTACSAHSPEPHEPTASLFAGPELTSPSNEYCPAPLCVRDARCSRFGNAAVNRASARAAPFGGRHTAGRVKQMAEALSACRIPKSRHRTARAGESACYFPLFVLE